MWHDGLIVQLGVRTARHTHNRHDISVPWPQGHKHKKKKDEDGFLATHIAVIVASLLILYSPSPIKKENPKKRTIL
jgi:hypothetical protein